MQIDNLAMAAGDMRQRIAIQAPTLAQNTYGEASPPEWETITEGERWAEYKSLSGRELLVARQINTSVTCAFILRYIADVTPRHRVLFRGRVFDINAVLNVHERRIKTVLLCTENV